MRAGSTVAQPGRLRVCLLSPTYPPVTGGAETHLQTLAEGLAARHDVRVITERYSGTTSAEIVNGVEVTRVRTPVDRWGAADDVPWEERLFGLLAAIESRIERPVDVLHGHCQAGVLVGAMLKSDLEAPLVATMHETTPERDPFGAGRSRFAYSQLPYDALIVGSEAFAAQAAAFGAPASRVHFISYGVHPMFAAPIPAGVVAARRRWMGAAAGDRVVLLVGRFKERKGISEFVDAMAQVVRGRPDVRAVVIGSLNSASAGYLEEVRRKIEERGLAGSVVLREATLPYEAMPSLYAAADAVVQPSHVEGLGLAAIEAALSGTPLVLTAAAGLSELIAGGVRAEVVPPGDVDALAAAIAASLTDGAVRAAAGNPEVALRRWGAPAMVAATERLYATLVRDAAPLRT